MAADEIHLGAKLIELVPDLLEAVLLGSAHEHVGQYRRGGGLALDVLLAAEAQGQHQTNRAAFGLLGQKRQLETVGQIHPGCAFLHVFDGGGKRLALGQRGAAFVTFHHGRHVGRLRQWCAIGCLVRQEHAQGAVGLLEIGTRHPFHV